MIVCYFRHILKFIESLLSLGTAKTFFAKKYYYRKQHSIPISGYMLIVAIN
jgi:hypothetical protein